MPGASKVLRSIAEPVFFSFSLLLFSFFLFSFCLILFALPPRSWRVPAIHIFPVSYGIFGFGPGGKPIFPEVLPSKRKNVRVESVESPKQITRKK